MAMSKRSFGLEFEMLMNLEEIFADNKVQHQELAEHATRCGAATIGPGNPQYLLYKSYQIPRKDWKIGRAHV